MTVPRIWREIPQRYRLEASKCKGCNRLFFPARLICPECRSRKFDKVGLNGRGKILTYTIIHVAPEQFKNEVPYAIGVIELEEGVRITAQIVDCEFSELAIGQEVRAEFRKIQEDGPSGVIGYGYKFVPTSPSGVEREDAKVSVT